MGKIKIKEIQHWTSFAGVYFKKILKVALPMVKNEAETFKYFGICDASKLEPWQDKCC